MKELKKLFRKYWLGCFLALVAMIIMNYLIGTVCLSKILIGIPCPACGMTRAAVLLLTGHVRESLQMHPLLILVILGIIFSTIIYIKYKNYVIFVKIYVIISVVIFVLYYFYRMRLYYPNIEPMVYRPDNCLYKIMLFLHNINTR